MTLHYKVGGEWTEVDRPYVKRNGVWTPVDEVFVKRSGAWAQSYVYDVTPPDIPDISLQILDTSAGGRYLRVGVRSPLSGHDPNLKRIRVLSTYLDKAPTTQFGGTYTAKPDDNYPEEPWSDFSYNGFNGSKASKNSATWAYKSWPRSASSTTKIEGGKTYYFTVWAEDLNGNWSGANAAAIWVPKEVVAGTDKIVKESRFQPVWSGTTSASGYTEGRLTQQQSRRGIWCYGNQLLNIGAQGNPNITSAQIRIQRTDDGGEPVSNVYLYWHRYTTPAQIPADPQDIVREDITFVGTVGKGEAKWIDLPPAFWAAMEAREVKGFGLASKDPAKAGYFAQDFSIMASREDNPRSGEVNVVWREHQ